jgi:uncharacterized glyoxalase superfamily protein PhnB
MGTSKTRPTVTTRIITPDPSGLVNFLRQVFDVDVDVEGEDAGDGSPVELRFGDSLVMISDGGGVHPISPAFLMVYVDDTDDVYARAKKAGATSEEEPEDMPWGARCALVRDGWGNAWQISTRP